VITNLNDWGEEAIVTKFNVVLLRGSLLALRRDGLTEVRGCPIRYSNPVLSDALPFDPTARYLIRTVDPCAVRDDNTLTAL